MYLYYIQMSNFIPKMYLQSKCETITTIIPIKNSKRFVSCPGSVQDPSANAQNTLLGRVRPTTAKLVSDTQCFLLLRTLARDLPDTPKLEILVASTGAHNVSSWTHATEQNSRVMRISNLRDAFHARVCVHHD